MGSRSLFLKEEEEEDEEDEGKEAGLGGLLPRLLARLPFHIEDGPRNPIGKKTHPKSIWADMCMRLA